MVFDEIFLGCQPHTGPFQCSLGLKNIGNSAALDIECQGRWFLEKNGSWLAAGKIPFNAPVAYGPKDGRGVPADFARDELISLPVADLNVATLRIWGWVKYRTAFGDRRAMVFTHDGPVSAEETAIRQGDNEGLNFIQTGVRRNVRLLTYHERKARYRNV